MELQAGKVYLVLTSLRYPRPSIQGYWGQVGSVSVSTAVHTGGIESVGQQKDVRQGMRKVRTRPPAYEVGTCLPPPRLYLTLLTSGT